MKMFCPLMYLLSAFTNLQAIAETQSLPSQPWPKLSSLEKKGAHISALMVPLDDLDEKPSPPLAALRPERRLTPASLTKIPLVVKALEKWGPQWTVSTPLLVRGERKGNTVVGDLVLMGAGDPSLVNEKLWFLSTDVYRAGITQVTGKLIVNTSLFGNEETPDSNRKDGQKRSQNAYNSPLSSVAVNYSVAAVVVSPGRAAGDPAYAHLEPYPLQNMKIINQAKTVGPGFSSQLYATRKSVQGIDSFFVSGNIAQGALPIRVYRSVGNAAAYAGAALVSFLEKSGVTIAKGFQEETTPPQPSDTPLVSVEGYPLDFHLKGILQFSNNFSADMLTKLLSKEPSGKTLSQGSQELMTSLLQLRSNHAPLVALWEKGAPVTQPPIFQSGSGLTPENKLSASDIILFLRSVYRSTRDFPVFLSALPLPGEKGTLKQRFQDPKWEYYRHALRAKTGTLNDPWPAVGLGGMLRLRTGKWVAFAIVVNDPKRQCGGIERIRQAIDADLMHMMGPLL